MAIRAALLFLLVTAGAVEAAQLTPANALDRRQISELALSPAADRLAFTVSELRDGRFTDDIWTLDLESGATRRLTDSPASDRLPRWSPDGEGLAFLSDRDGSAQIFIIRKPEGEAAPLTRQTSPVHSFEWSPDGELLAYLAVEPPSEAARRRPQAAGDPRVVDQDPRHPQVWLLDVSTGESRQLTRAPWRVSELTWAREGDRLFVVASERPQPFIYTDGIYSVAVRDGATKLIVKPSGPFGLLKVSPDGRSIGYVGPRADDPVAHDLLVQSVAGGRSTNATMASIDRTINDFQWREDGTLLVLAQTGFSDTFYEADARTGARVKDGMMPVTASSFVIGGDVLAYAGESATRAPEIWISRGRGGDGAGGAPPLPATELNRRWSEIALVQPELVRYRSDNGLEIEAALLNPVDLAGGGRPRTRPPVVVMLHGGPTWRWSDSYDALGQLLAARGIGVLYPNVRGSTGYGYDFQYMNWHDWGGGDFRDVLAGVDFLVGQGRADRARLGVWGRSYGGYLTAWAITQTQQFRAAVAVAPMTDLASEYGTTTARASLYDEWFLGTPYDNLDLYIERSPVTYVQEALTPILLLCGELDPVNPIGQCQQFHRGLRYHGIESQLVVYPQEGHRLREYQHQVDALERTLQWFEERLR